MNTQWNAIYIGMLGMRSIRIERDANLELKVTTTDRISGKQVEIQGKTPGELKERILSSGTCTEAETAEIIKRILYR